MIKIKLAGYRGGYALIDNEDFDRVMADGSGWRIDQHGCVVRNIPKSNGHRTRLARIVCDAQENEAIYHADQNNLNCQKSNLIKMPKTQRRGENPGVFFSTQRNMYRATISVMSKRHHLGYFVNKDDAVAARKKAEEQKEADGHKRVGIYLDKESKKWRVFANGKYLGRYQDYEQAKKAQENAQTIST